MLFLVTFSLLAFKSREDPPGLKPPLVELDEYHGSFTEGGVLVATKWRATWPFFPLVHPPQKALGVEGGIPLVAMLEGSSIPMRNHKDVVLRSGCRVGWFAGCRSPPGRCSIIDAPSSAGELLFVRQILPHCRGGAPPPFPSVPGGGA